MWLYEPHYGSWLARQESTKIFRKRPNKLGISVSSQYILARDHLTPFRELIASWQWRFSTLSSSHIYCQCDDMIHCDKMVLRLTSLLAFSWLDCLRKQQRRTSMLPSSEHTDPPVPSLTCSFAPPTADSSFQWCCSSPLSPAQRMWGRSGSLMIHLATSVKWKWSRRVRVQFTCSAVHVGWPTQQLWE